MTGGLLPGGWFDPDGRLQRDFELAALTGREEEVLAQARHPRPAALITEILSRCVRRLGTINPVPPEVIRDLLVADRHYLMLQLRRATFGDRVRADLFCPWPDCGERISVDFALTDLPVQVAAQPGPVHTMTLAGSAAPVVFRLPTGADQEDLADLLAENEAAALTALLTRCVHRIGDETPNQDSIAVLPAADRLQIERRMRELAPSVAQTIDVRCTECTRMFAAPFDIQRYFLGELRTDASLLYQEVHYLAYHYHWAESEIMELTRDKRRTYIDVLAEAVGALNDGD